jgi:mono/diheme cytochrome c family protein
MNFSKAVIALVAIWSVGVISSVGAQAPKPATAAAGSSPVAKSVWDGAFTEAQAKRGAEAYEKNCAECHQQELGGDGFAPALAGADFLNAWNGLSVGDLYDRIRVSMPPGKESSVPNQEKIDTVAYILQFNKFPAGQAELVPQVEVTKQIKFEATKPGK